MPDRCVGPLCGIAVCLPVWHRCVGLLCGIAVRHRFVASLCGILLGQCCVASLCGIAVGDRCGISVRRSCVGPLCGIVFWRRCVQSLCGIAVQKPFGELLCGIALWAYVCYRCVQSVHWYRPIGGAPGGPSRSISREKTVPPHPERSITVEKCTKSMQNSDSAIRRPILTAFCHVKTHVPPPLVAPSIVLDANAAARGPHVLHMYIYFAPHFAQTPSQPSRPRRGGFSPGESPSNRFATPKMRSVGNAGRNVCNVPRRVIGVSMGCDIR